MQKTILAATLALTFSANVLAAQSCRYDQNNQYQQYMGSCTDDNGCYPYNTVRLDGREYAVNADDHWTAFPLYLNGQTYTRGAFIWNDGYKDIYQICGNFGPDFSRYGYDNSTSACPATQPNGAIFIQRRYEVWSDGSVRNYTGWYETGRTCSAGFVYYGYDNSTSACPVEQPSGAVNIQRRYEVWSDGSARNYTGWYETSRSCSAVYRSTEIQSQSLSCASYGGVYTEGGNGISQRKTREIWSDGARAWSGWQTIQNTCYRNVTDEKDQRTNACAEGQKGHITTILRRNHIEYASDSAKSQAERNGLNEKNSTMWTTVVIENTCKDVPSYSWPEEGTKVTSCSEAKGPGYTGSIIQYGTYHYSYSSLTKKTTSTFDETSTSENCAPPNLAFADVRMETYTAACDDGQTGVKTFYRNAATNLAGTKSYPNGDGWALLSSNCTSNAIENSSIQAQTAIEEPQGLISNLSVTSSSLMKSSDSIKYLASLKSKAWDAKETHNLEIVVDDLAGYKYSAAKVSELATGFVDAVGTSKANVFISLPYSASQMVGVGEITSANARQTIIKSVDLIGGVAKVKYRIATGSGNDKDKEATVNILSGKAKSLNVIIK